MKVLDDYARISRAAREIILLGSEESYETL